MNDVLMLLAVTAYAAAASGVGLAVAEATCENKVGNFFAGVFFAPFFLILLTFKKLTDYLLY